MTHHCMCGCSLENYLENKFDIYFVKNKQRYQDSASLVQKVSYQWLSCAWIYECENSVVILFII